MAKKKAKARSKKTPKKNVARKKVAKQRSRKTTPKKKATRKPTRKATRKATKKVARKTARKSVKARKAARPAKAKRAVKAAALPKPATKPKRPRRTKQALRPASRFTPPPIVDVEPIAPAAPPAPPAPVFPQPTVEAETIQPRPAPTLNAGEMAPDFSLPDQSGQMHTLSQYRGKKVVLYFYPKDDTPGCTTEACGFRDTLGQYADRGAVVLGVSPDPIGSHQRFVQKYGLTFPLLADEGHHVAERYGVWGEKSRMGEITMGMLRTTFVIDADGRIQHVFHDVQPEGHEQEVLNVL